MLTYVQNKERARYSVLEAVRTPNEIKSGCHMTTPMGKRLMSYFGTQVGRLKHRCVKINKYYRTFGCDQEHSTELHSYRVERDVCSLEINVTAREPLRVLPRGKNMEVKQREYCALL